MKQEVKIKGWVARDGDGYWGLHRSIPKRKKDFGGYWDSGDGWDFMSRTAFPDLKWEDEPIEVELTIKRV